MASAVMIQIRNVPSKLHRLLKARAALAGKTLSDYLLDDIKRSVEQPTMEEWLASLEKLDAVEPGVSVAELLREERDR